MTHFRHYFAACLRQRTRLFGFACGLEVAIVAGIIFLMAIGWINSDLSVASAQGALVSGGILAAVVLYIRLAAFTEHTWGRNLDRLVPISESARYTANQLATLVWFCAFFLLQIVLWNLFAVLDGGAFNFTSGDWGFGSWLLAVLTLSFLWGFVLVSLVHLLTTLITTFLPGRRQKLVTQVLYVVVAIAVIWFINWVIDLITHIAGSALKGWFNHAFNVEGTHFGEHPGILFIALAVFALIIAGFSAVNVYLLKHWTETQTQP